MGKSAGVIPESGQRIDKYRWESFSQKKGPSAHIEDALGGYKAGEFLFLIEAWLPSAAGQRILKTDLSEEAFGEDHILFSRVLQGGAIFAIDISPTTVAAAHKRQRQAQLRQTYVCGDVRCLPVAKGVFDIILSTSTLDHFNCERDFIASLRELRRVVKDDGHMMLAVNNRLNVNYYLMVCFGKLLGMIPYPVQFFLPADLRRLVEMCGWEVEEQEFIVHVISPASTLLKTARKILPRSFVDSIAGKIVAFSRWLGKRKWSRGLTGWFIALKCCPRASP